MSLRCFNIALIWAKESSNSSIDNLRVPPELQKIREKLFTQKKSINQDFSVKWNGVKNLAFQSKKIFREIERSQNVMKSKLLNRNATEIEVYLFRADVRFFVSSSNLSQQTHKCSALMQLSESALSNLL